MKKNIFKFLIFNVLLIVFIPCYMSLRFIGNTSISDRKIIGLLFAIAANIIFLFVTYKAKRKIKKVLLIITAVIFSAVVLVSQFGGSKLIYLSLLNKPSLSYTEIVYEEELSRDCRLIISKDTEKDTYSCSILRQSFLNVYLENYPTKWNSESLFSDIALPSLFEVPGISHKEKTMSICYAGISDEVKRAYIGDKELQIKETDGNKFAYLVFDMSENLGTERTMFKAEDLKGNIIYKVKL